MDTMPEVTREEGRRWRGPNKSRSKGCPSVKELRPSWRADEPEVDQRHEDVETKREFNGMKMWKRNGNSTALSPPPRQDLEFVDILHHEGRG